MISIVDYFSKPDTETDRENVSSCSGYQRWLGSPRISEETIINERINKMEVCSTTRVHNWVPLPCGVFLHVWWMASNGMT